MSRAGRAPRESRRRGNEEEEEEEELVPGKEVESGNSSICHIQYIIHV